MTSILRAGPSQVNGGSEEALVKGGAWADRSAWPIASRGAGRPRSRGSRNIPAGVTGLVWGRVTSAVVGARTRLLALVGHDPEHVRHAVTEEAFAPQGDTNVIAVRIVDQIDGRNRGRPDAMRTAITLV